MSGPKSPCQDPRESRELRLAAGSVLQAIAGSGDLEVARRSERCLRNRNRFGERQILIQNIKQTVSYCIENVMVM